MKKILVTILTVAMMTSAVAAFADGGPQGGPMDGQPPRMEQGQQAPEKPDAAPEKPTGEKPADAPAEPEDLTGERPEMPSEKQSQAFVARRWRAARRGSVQWTTDPVIADFLRRFLSREWATARGDFRVRSTL